MQLVEQHILTSNDSRFQIVDRAAFAAKNLYNAANYLVRQSFIFQGAYLNYYAIHAQMKRHEAYQALPRKVNQQVLRMLDKNWQGFFAAMKAYRADVSRFRKKPGLPRYLDKKDGHYPLVYTIQALSKPALKQGVIVPSGLAISVVTKQTRIAQVRIVPKGQFYVVEVVYEKEIEPAAVDPDLVAGIDVGLNNLAAIASNKPGFVPILVNGRPAKYINQGYNKRRAELQAKLGQPGRTKRMERLTTRRTRQINHYLHTHSRRIIALLVREGIGTLVIGKNDGWKQEISIGKRNNQNFVQVPHARFIEILSYKAELVGIQVLLVNESHTSKCSFLDDEPVQHQNAIFRYKTQELAMKRYEKRNYATIGPPVPLYLVSQGVAMTIQEKLYFVRQLQHSYTSIGALIPTSRYAARAMASEATRRAGPRAILEVGPGTGSITAAIVAGMGPEDRLVLCELNADFVAYLRRRLDAEPEFQRVRDQVTLLHMDVTQLDRGERFDCIVSAIPFTNCPPAVIESILECYREILKPDGVLSYIEYAYMRMLKERLLTGEARRELADASAVLDRSIDRYQFRRDLVYRNVPPAWVRHLRFEQSPASAALNLAPAEHNRRIPLGAAAGISTEALPWLLGLLALGLFGPLRRMRGLLLLAAAAVAAFFRDPPRHVVPDADVAFAACDGRVLSVERVVDERFGAEEWLRIAVFLSLANVHINRSPVAGKVLKVVRQDGGFAPADSADAEHNSAVYTLIEGPHGSCVVAQRSGLVARRIVTWSKPGELLAQGDRYGLIRFGSRTDVYLPARAFAANVAPGDTVRAGETVIARAI